jgi:hypothetical protein
MKASRVNIRHALFVTKNDFLVSFEIIEWDYVNSNFICDIYVA